MAIAGPLVHWDVAKEYSKRIARELIWSQSMGFTITDGSAPTLALYLIHDGQPGGLPPLKQQLEITKLPGASHHEPRLAAGADASAPDNKGCSYVVRMSSTEGEILRTPRKQRDGFFL